MVNPDRPLPSLSQRRLLDLIQQNNGWLTFEQFMAAALYDSEFGYYSAQVRDVGRTGDFSTSAQVDSLLGRAIARWAQSEKKRLGLGLRWHLIEVGGGNGEMAATILKNLGLRGRLGLTYHLVEISRPLRERQIQKLKGHRFRWHDSTAAAVEATAGVGLIFSNELVDAFPCRRLRYTGQEWQEIGLAQADGVIRETSRPLDEIEVRDLKSSVLAVSGKSPQVVEIHASYRRNLLQTAEKLTRGSLLTIDYGDRFPALYHRQPEGTARGYFHHLRVEGAELYTRLGQQDLTADVNFTDLENWGSEAGLTNDRLDTQRDFIVRWLGQIAPKTTDEARLLDPIGAGSAFKVLQQSKTTG